MANLFAILAEEGDQQYMLIDVTVFLTDMANDFNIFNEKWATAFPSVAYQPCRTTVEVSALEDGAAIEFKAIGALPE